MKKYKIHEAAKIWPEATEEELQSIVSSMRQHGYDKNFPILLFEDQVLDGRNRLRAAEVAEVEPVFATVTCEDPYLETCKFNASRRHLSQEQKAQIGADLFEFYGHGIHGKSVHHEHSLEQIANILGVSISTIRRAKELKEKNPEAAKKVISGESTTGEELKEIKRQEYIEHNEDIKTKKAKEVEGVFDVIVVDPPWDMKKLEREDDLQVSELDYPTMTNDEIKAIKIPAHTDCHVWLWTTQKRLPIAFEIFEAWGINYVCTFVWHKPGGFQVAGLPQYNCEFALYGRIGTPKFIDLKNFNTCFSAPRTGHSEKPEEFYAMVRRVTVGRRLDKFNRRQIDGFETWGNEAQ